jgi:hypothetical protein
MRYPGYKTFAGMVFYGSPNLGPKAVPGTYKVRLSVDGQQQEQPFEILKDPRLATTQEDYQAQFDFLIKVRDKVSEANQAIIDIRKIKSELAAVREKVGGDAANKDVVEAVKKFEGELTAIENNIHETRNRSVQDPINYGIKLNNRIAHLMVEQGQGDFRPNRQAEEVFAALSQLLDKELQSLQALVSSQGPALNKLIRDKGIDVLTIR